MNEMTPAPLPDYMAGPPIDIEAGASPKFRLRKFLVFLRSFWWVPVASLVLGLAAAVIYIRLHPPTFVCDASMWETAKINLPDGSLFSEDMADFLGTQAELLQSDHLRDLALTNMVAANSSAIIPRDQDGQPLPVKIRVLQSSKSTVFSLEATGSQAGYVHAYLNALMDTYLAYQRDVHQQVSGYTLASISDQVKLAEQELTNQLGVLTEFQRTNNLAILQEKGTVAGGYLTRLKTELSDLQLSERLLESTPDTPDVVEAATNQTSQTNLGTAELTGLPGSGTGGGGNQDQLNAYKELELLEMQKAELGSNLLETHPRMVKLDEDIERAQGVLDIYRREDRGRQADSLATTRMKIQNVQGSIKEWEGIVVESSARISEAERLKLNVQRAQGDYERLATLMENFRISRNIDQDTLTILQPASPARRSYAMEKSSLGTSGLGGLALGLLFIAWLTIRDEKFSSVMEVNEKFGDAVIAQVPEVAGLNRKLQFQLEDVGQMHLYEESYRCLRSALLFTSVEGGRPRVLLITSALPDEGKSTVAVNLARTMALGGARVLLVDADLRRGGLHEFLGLRQEPGLAQLLGRPADADSAVQTNSVPNLWLVSCGSRLRNPGDLFLGAGLEQLLNRWRGQYDYVVIDSSPIFAADDATTLAPKVDATLLVVRSRFSNARQVREALDLLHQRQARVLGVVFNRADASARSYNYYKYASYYPAAGALPVKSG